MERRCGDRREARSACADALPTRFGVRFVTNDGDEATALMTVDPTMAVPGPMYELS